MQQLLPLLLERQPQLRNAASQALGAWAALLAAASVGGAAHASASQSMQVRICTLCVRACVCVYAVYSVRVHVCLCVCECASARMRACACTRVCACAWVCWVWVAACSAWPRQCIAATRVHLPPYLVCLPSATIAILASVLKCRVTRVCCTLSACKRNPFAASIWCCCCCLEHASKRWTR